MAIFHPSNLPSVKFSGGRYRERDVLDRLQQSLSNDYEIFHSIPMHIVHEQLDRFTEIDIAIIGPTGNLLLIEVKAGDVSFRDGHIFKLYSDKEHNIERQCRFQLASIRGQLANANINAFVSHCLVLPDFQLNSHCSSAFPSERIIDAGKFEQLGTYVKEFLSVGSGCSDVNALRHFLKNEFQISMDLGALREQTKNTVRILSDGLSTWVPRISSSHGVYCVSATAGSGKTQLALTLIENAIEQKHNAIYVCYNRSLADHMRKIAPARANIVNFHELCVDHFRKFHGEPDFSKPQIFDSLITTYKQDSEHFPENLDVLIIDEGQDFEADWIDMLGTKLKSDGRLYFLEDTEQRIYQRDPIELKNAVTITCRDNFRTPKIICDVINALKLTKTSIRALNPFKGEVPDFKIYQSDASLIKETADAIKDLINQGFSKNDIVILSSRGQSSSKLLALDQIGEFKLKKFTGKYDKNGEAVWTNGDVLIDSVYRYKGKSAAAVILSELSFDELNDLEARKLFVGMTRAQLALSMIMTKQVELILSERLS
jgi:hypothetical protein